MIILDWIFDFFINKILYSYKPICQISVDIRMKNEFTDGEINSVKEYLKNENNKPFHYCFELVHPEKITRNPRIIENILNLKENNKEVKRFKENFHLLKESSKYIKNIHIIFYYKYKHNPSVDIGIDLCLVLPNINSLATDKDIELEYSIVKHYKYFGYDKNYTKTTYGKNYTEDIDIGSFKDFKRLVFYTSLLRRLKRDSILE